VAIALCDVSGADDGRAAALVAAAQMAVAAEEVGLAPLLAPVGGSPEFAGVLPGPGGARLEVLLALGLAGETPRSGAATAAPAGVETLFAAAAPPRPPPDEGDGGDRVLLSFTEIAAATAGAEDLDEVLRMIARALGRVFPVDGAALGLVEEGAIVVREVLRRGRAVRREPERLPSDGTHLFGHVIQGGRPLWRNDVPSEVRFAESLPGTGMRSDMVIPLRARGRIIGAFQVACRRRYAFDPEDFEVLQRSADLTAVAVETQRLLQRTKRLSETDGLTGLANHQHALALLEQELEAARRSRRPLSLLMIDVDDFKRCNDQHGHPAGDEVLRHVAQLAARLLRRTDVVGRYGGEEFVVILPDAAAGGAAQAAESIRAEIERNPVPLPSGSTRLEVRVSIGAATFPDDARGPADLVAAADAALYRAKRGGKNRVCRAGEERAGRAPAIT
jgi:two-component system cell cycle response regulator